MKGKSSWRFHIKPNDWVWWAWTVTTVLLTVGLLGYGWAFTATIGVIVGQGLIVLVRDRSLFAYSVQLRAAYLLLLLVGYVPGLQWFRWLLVAGTFALVIFGYCFLTRVLSLLPWNSRGTYTFNRLRRTFLSAPNLDRVTNNPAIAGRAGGLCTIEAQIEPSESANGLPITSNGTFGPLHRHKQ